MTTELTDQSVRSILKALRDFGYSSLTEAEVREAARKVIAGEPTDGDIIAMFVGRMLRDAGVVAR